MEEATTEGESHQEHVYRWKTNGGGKSSSTKRACSGGRMMRHKSMWPPGNQNGSEMGVPGTVVGKVKHRAENSTIVGSP